MNNFGRYYKLVAMAGFYGRFLWKVSMEGFYGRLRFCYAWMYSRLSYRNFLLFMKERSAGYVTE